MPPSRKPILPMMAEAAPAYLRPKFMAVAVAPVNIKPKQKTIRRTEPS